MKADLTRNSFDPFKQFTRVLLQQGRVQLDADWNEQASILLKYLQALAADLIGPHGGPISDLGFRIADGTLASDVAIGPGHYYVDGILCELASPSAPVPVGPPSPANPNQFQILGSSFNSFAIGKPVLLSADGTGLSLTLKVTNVSSSGLVTVDPDPDLAVTDILKAPNPRAYTDFATYLNQPDYPNPPKLVTNSLLYLDVWERLITSVEDDTIREVALDGADTAARAKLVCQVKQLAGGKGDTNLYSQLQPANRGRLIAQAKQAFVSTDPCVIAPDATYRGPENQLYRVEIHTGSGKDANGSALIPTFKWSRENGSVIFPIVNLSSGNGGTTVVLENLGRDDRFGLKENDWVELVDDDYVLINSVGKLLQVQSIDSGSLTVVLGGSPSSTVGQNPAKHPLLRRWDESAGDESQGGLQLQADNAAKIIEGSDDANWLVLENGIQIQFQPAPPQTSANQYRTGDYWLIPARTATGDVEWPSGDSGPIAMPPDGVDHHYAPLAVITVKDSDLEVTVSSQYSFLPMPSA